MNQITKDLNKKGFKTKGLVFALRGIFSKKEGYVIVGMQTKALNKNMASYERMVRV